MKRALYYLIIFYSIFMVGGLFSSYLKEFSAISRLRITFLSPILYIIMGIPYNFSISGVVLTAYYLNENKRKKSRYSFTIALLVGALILFTLALIDSTFRESKMGNEITFWDSLNFSTSGIFDFWKLFLIGIFLFTLLLIPIHSYFRKKFNFLNEAE